jgi:hypothetical protein
VATILGGIVAGLLYRYLLEDPAEPTPPAPPIAPAPTARSTAQPSRRRR